MRMATTISTCKIATSKTQVEPNHDDGNGYLKVANIIDFAKRKRAEGDNMKVAMIGKELKANITDNQEAEHDDANGFCTTCA